MVSKGPKIGLKCQDLDSLEHFLRHVVGLEKDFELRFVQVVGKKRLGIRFELEWPKET